MRMKFHWRLLHGGERAGHSRAEGAAARATGRPELPVQIEFCERAEEAGITGLLTDVGAAKPDPLLLAAALGLATDEVEFIVAFRSNLSSPTYFVQQLNTLSHLIGGRLSLNVVAGHSPLEQRFYGDHLPHDERYARTEEFLAVCHAFWSRERVSFEGKYYRIENGALNTPYAAPGRRFPEIFIGGGSDPARRLAIRQGTCWMRLADTPERVATSIEPVLAAGKEAGLRLSIILGPSREEALATASDLRASVDPTLREKQREAEFAKKSDSVSIRATYDLAATEWLTPCLWTGLVRTHGAPCMALVGSPDEVAAALVEYGRVGVTHFILSGWPKREAMIDFGREVIPRVRALEARVTPGRRSAGAPGSAAAGSRRRERALSCSPPDSR